MKLYLAIYANLSIYMEYSKTYDKCNVPDSYLSDLFNYLKRNQYIKGTDDYNSFTLSIKSEMPALENLKSKCIYTYFLNLRPLMQCNATAYFLAD